MGKTGLLVTSAPTMTNRSTIQQQPNTQAQKYDPKEQPQIDTDRRDRAVCENNNGTETRVDVWQDWVKR